MKHPFFLVTALFLPLLLLCSCEADISLELQGSQGTPVLSVQFSGSFGDALQGLILAAGNGDTEIFDATEIAAYLAQDGFSEISVHADGATLRLSMQDAGCKSILFTSALLSQNTSGKVRLNISKNQLKAFYDTADEQTQMLLDLFLAPVFNDEEMPPSEYTQMIGTIYGADAMTEIESSAVKITIKNADGTSQKKSFPLAALLCGTAKE